MIIYVRAHPLHTWIQLEGDPDPGPHRLALFLPWGPDDTGESLTLGPLPSAVCGTAGSHEGKSWNLNLASASFCLFGPFSLLSSLSFLPVDRAASQPSLMAGRGSFQSFLRVFCHLPVGGALLTAGADAFTHRGNFLLSQWFLPPQLVFCPVALHSWGSSGSISSSSFNGSSWISLPSCECLPRKHACTDCWLFLWSLCSLFRWLSSHNSSICPCSSLSSLLRKQHRWVAAHQLLIHRAGDLHSLIYSFYCQVAITQCFLERTSKLAIFSAVLGIWRVLIIYPLASSSNICFCPFSSCTAPSWSFLTWESSFRLS